MTYRSIAEPYIPQIVREYRHWTLMINERHRYLGRCVVWLVREGEMQRYSSLSDGEIFELRDIVRAYEKAVDALWRPDHMNYAWYGNEIESHGGHGHMHLVPRYRGVREFNGVLFEDQNWGRPPSPAEPFDIPRETLFKIRDTLRDAL